MTRPNMSKKWGRGPMDCEYWEGLWEREARNNPGITFDALIISFVLNTMNGKCFSELPKLRRRKEPPLNTVFSFPPTEIRLLLTGGLFLACAGVMFLCIYQGIGGCPPRKRLLPLILFALLLPLLSYTSAAAVETAYALPFPWLWLIPLSAGVLVWSLWGALGEHRRAADTLSPLSVKQAVDDLAPALCFADENGRIILINRKMGELSAALFGRFPANMRELAGGIRSRLFRGAADEAVGSSALFRFPDGKIWRFETNSLKGERLKGYTQLTGFEVTELVQGNENLKQGNQELLKTNEQLQEMYERLSDRIREQETLNLKIRVHNDIGACLITLSELLEKDQPEASEKELQRLKSAISYFGGAPAALRLDAVQKQAAEMGVALSMEGKMPIASETESLIALALRECISNCILHAKGDAVNVCFKEENGRLTAAITNNGIKPEGPIKEGGGLSSVRRRIEDAGASMELRYLPRFALILSFGQP